MQFTLKAGKFLAYFTASIWLVAGIAYLLVSGNTSTFLASGVAGLFIVLALFFHFISALVIIAKGLLKLKGRSFWTTSLKIVLVSMVLSDLFFVLGTRMGNAKLLESKQRGDVLYKMIEDFKSEEGRLPDSLDELQTKKGELPSPAFSGTKFGYRKLEQESFFIIFPSVAWTQC